MQCGKKPEVESTIGSEETGRDDMATKPTTSKVNSRAVGAIGARDFIDEIDFLDHGQAVSPFDVKNVYKRDFGRKSCHTKKNSSR